MSCWSAENATKAYLSTLKMSQRAKEPAVAEFISALAAGNNAQVMVVACATVVDSTTLALVAAANQTGGLVVCIVQSNEELKASKNVLGMFSCQVQFIVGDAKDILLNQYEAADFVLIDCNLVNHQEIFRSIQCRKQNGTVVVGYNAFRCRGSWRSCGSKTQLLPIGEGLLVTRFEANATTSPKYGSEIRKNRSHWVKRVDKCTGEEHVYRIRFPQGKVIQA
ncbi:putative S-adenosyl-L-methionine-dependent methyltransferase [Lupinus albus]|uniref:Putative S-adenosyl-L-methionine-dependent methyltransferase n=1 Tax=Lupinus albus TaxID=3870 RepID=A0A6A4QUE4_LUPAL|nr:putative S-adenosyl-L-methionine-dependent methyltransferase [Lupinus albus]